MQRFLWFTALLASSACLPFGRGSTPAPAASIPYRVVGTDTLRAQVFRAKGAAPAAKAAVLLVHEGDWVGGSASMTYDAAAAFADAGFVAIAIEYRLADARHTPVDALEDVCAAIVWARAHADSLGFPRDRVAGFGAGNGGHLVASTPTVGCPFPSLNRGVDALLLVSPLLDATRDSTLRPLLHGRAEPAQFSPLANLGLEPPPTMIAQGDRDTVTPLLSAQRFCLAITTLRQRCELAVYSDLGHLLRPVAANQTETGVADPIARKDAIQRHVAFLRSLWP